MLKYLEGSWQRGLEQDLKASHWNLLRCWEKTELEAKFICLKGDDWLSTIYIYTIIIIKKTNDKYWNWSTLYLRKTKKKMESQKENKLNFTPL
jgi:hypothetical protein